MSEAPSAGGRETIRLDKWLWQARFFKSRSLAGGVVSGGKVRVNAQPTAKPARAIGAGDLLTFAQGDAVRVVRVLACGSRRGPASEAQALYDDLSPLVPATAPPRQSATPGADGGRPSGRDRRARAALEARAHRNPASRDPGQS